MPEKILKVRYRVPHENFQRGDIRDLPESQVKRIEALRIEEPNGKSRPLNAIERLGEVDPSTLPDGKVRIRFNQRVGEYRGGQEIEVEAGVADAYVNGAGVAEYLTAPEKAPPADLQDRKSDKMMKPADVAKK